MQRRQFLGLTILGGFCPLFFKQPKVSPNATLIRDRGIVYAINWKKVQKVEVELHTLNLWIVVDGRRLYIPKKKWEGEISATTVESVLKELIKQEFVYCFYNNGMAYMKVPR